MALKMRGLTNARPQPTTKDERLCIASPPPPRLFQTVCPLYINRQKSTGPLEKGHRQNKLVNLKFTY